MVEAWNGNASRWSKDVRAGYDKYRAYYTLPAYLEFMPSIHGRRVIDLGCGEGSNTRRFANLGAQVTGVDLSALMISLARVEEERDPLGIRYEIQSFSDLSMFADGSFDCALSTMALMDGPDFAAAMRAAYRVLVPGGTLCFSILHPCIMTPVFKWLQSEDGVYEGYRAGRYFDEEPFVERWHFSKRPDGERVEQFKVPRFPRTLSTYINAVSDAGFRITALDEPRPSEAAAQDHPWLARWREHAPLVLFVEASKI
ncbi:class I SAM-dependent methyltransferase [Pelagibius sp. Alg239-R121]|uniref:class I SAM-dependent methyltransferase n=1 Tax=Pelagibius sp. Alg239-R121 TaxID=2993448 RepID=UPI0024A71DA3|nr:class I SAM-dependent methyltransferase [Pelagibius sp. Alg239-R121]